MKSYKEAFVDEVTDLIAENIADRTERMAAVKALTDAYVNLTGSAPDDRQSLRLADYIMREELTDKHPDKMSNSEYPIMSDYQLARRQFGAHKAKNPIARIEVPLSSLMNLGTDGVDYSYPKRRQRTIDEMIYMDEVTVSRNKERRRKYKQFVNGKSKGVFTVNIATGEKAIHDQSCDD
ncbi:hypothetical protein [Paenibacillus abyssi]|uniref:Uncharacterized protein n=1 Tax=Paenibacillus abyssi TaxID=1340531 RepID=A0A917FKN6_9BACL|nr:hypothetical protein [Paenibacillus abyssi]GGF88339.1 hypothetical protein GCM10010916_02100 [Paenibacillus abyssi]